MGVHNDRPDVSGCLECREHIDSPWVASEWGTFIDALVHVVRSRCVKAPGLGDVIRASLHCWEPEGEPDTFVYLVAFADAAASEAAWKAFGADPDWKAGKAASEANGPLLARQTTTVLRPSAFSPGAH